MHAILLANPASEFKADQCSQAVAEECKGHVQKWSQALGESFDKRRESSERTLHQPSPPSRQLNRADVDIRRQAVGPGAKDQRTGSGGRKTKQAKTALWTRLAE